ncbi:hypothetical protein BOV91_11440, partial [Solemya velum gill symbiont]
MASTMSADTASKTTATAPVADLAEPEQISSRIHQTVAELTDQVVEVLTRRSDSDTLHIEDIQDQVELALMRSGEHKVARAYVLYREEQKKKRAEDDSEEGLIDDKHIVDVTLADGTKAPIDHVRLTALVNEACKGLEDVDSQKIIDGTCR